MRRICFFIHSVSSAGGTERVCTEIANQLSNSGYWVTILSMYGTAPFFYLNPEIRVVPVFAKKRRVSSFLPLLLIRLRKKINAIAPQVLINADSALFAFSLSATVGSGIKNVVWEHFNFNVSLNSAIRVFSRKLAARYSDGIITLTRRDKHNWMSALNCKVPVYTINNPSSVNGSASRFLNRKPIVLSIGRLTHQKGFDRLLDIWYQIKLKGYTEWELHIVGSGELYDLLRQRAAKLNIEQTVKMIPATHDIQQHYQQASIYCMTSRFEGFGLVLIEAQSFGLPVVSYDCEAGPAEIINKDEGILVNNNDQGALVDALIYLMDNREVRISMGARAFNNSLNYLPEVIINNWKHLLQVDLNQ